LPLLVSVLGRRRYARFSIPSSDGLLNVQREIAARPGPNGELIALDREARSEGEIVTVEFLIKAVPSLCRMRVVSSNPVLRDGMVFHEVRLSPLHDDAGDRETR
jgi:hypothetical protein